MRFFHQNALIKIKAVGDLGHHIQIRFNENKEDHINLNMHDRPIQPELFSESRFQLIGNEAAIIESRSHRKRLEP